MVEEYWCISQKFTHAVINVRLNFRHLFDGSRIKKQRYQEEEIIYVKVCFCASTLTWSTSIGPFSSCLNQVRALIPDSHLIVARGKPEENHTYCTKEDFKE